MPETVQQYRERLLSLLDGANPLTVQAATPAKLKRLIRGRSENQLRRQPQPGTWSPAEIIVHLADCEIVYGYRIRSILSSPGAPIQSFDQDKWAEALRYNRQPVAAAVEAFAMARENNLGLLRTLSREQWHCFGEHAERGPETVEMIANMLAGHDLNHLRQIEERLAPAAPRTRAKAKKKTPARR